MRCGTKALASLIAGVDDEAWTAIGYTYDGEAQVTECVYRDRRLVVHRTRLTGAARRSRAPTGGTSGLTDLAGDAVDASTVKRRRFVAAKSGRD